MIILGRPGSGKTHLISQLITREVFFSKKFERILYVGPSVYEGVIQDEGNWCKNIDLGWIESKCREANGWASNILIIFDDVVSQLPNTHRNGIQNLFYTRRHIVPSATISIIFTTQKYTACPAWLRLCSNILITFGIQGL